MMSDHNPHILEELKGFYLRGEKGTRYAGKERKDILYLLGYIEALQAQLKPLACGRAMTHEDLLFIIDRQGAPRVARLGHIYALHDDVAVFELELHSKRCEAVGGAATLDNEDTVPLILIEATEDSTGLGELEGATRVVFPLLAGWEAHVSGGAKYTLIVTLVKTPVYAGGSHD